MRECKRRDKVRVYRNLNKKCLSVQSWVDGKGWRVTDHVQRILLDNVSFEVSQSGRKRVIDQQSKNVHAFVVGCRVERPKEAPIDLVKYDPYVSSSFFYTDKPTLAIGVATSAEITTHSIKVATKAT